MPWQLLYTSAPAGLVPGRSGFCTVARHRAIPERLVVALERISVYEPPAGRIPIFTYRHLALGDERYGILSRYGDAGLDYTSRRNYLAHHLIFSAEEMRSIPPPAEIARRWSGWKTAWDEQPRWLDDAVQLPGQLLRAETRLPAQSWQNLTRDAGHAAALCPNGAVIDTVLLRAGHDDATLLRLLAEASLLLRNGPFSSGFTTCIQNTDTPSDLPWRFSSEGAGLALDHFPPPPDTSVVRHARTGISPAHQPRAVSSPLLSSARRNPPPVSSLAQSESASETASLKPWIIGSLTALVLVGGSAAVWFFSAAESAPAPRPVETAPAQPSSQTPPSAQNFSDIYAVNNLLRDLDAAVASQQWPRSAELWLQLQKDHPDELAKRPPDHLALIRRQLPAALAGELEGQFRLLEPKFSTEAIAAFAEKLQAAQARLAQFNITPSAQETPGLFRLSAQLRLLQSLPAQPPEWAFLQWESAKNPGETSAIFDSKPLRQFLQKKHTALRLQFVPRAQWDSESPVEPIVLIPAAGAFSPGQSLLLSPAPNTAPRLQFQSKGGRSNIVVLTRTLPQNPTPLEKWFAEQKSLQVTFSDTDSSESLTLLLVHPEAPPAPISAPLALLDQTANSLSLPSWLRSALQPFIPSQTRLVFHPAETPATPKDIPGVAIDRPALLQILQSGLTALRAKRVSLEKEISDLESRRITAEKVDAIDTQLREFRAALEGIEKSRQALANRISSAQSRQTPLGSLEENWQASLLDNRTGQLLPLIRFTR